MKTNEEKETDKILQEHSQNVGKIVDEFKTIFTPVESPMPETPHPDPAVNMADYFARRIKG